MQSRDTTNGPHRHDCIACGSKKLHKRWSVTSSFFAERALLTKPEIVPILKCLICGTEYFDLLVTDEQLDRLYDDYRGEKYFKQRNCFEPWYTKELNSGLGGEIEMRKRRDALNDALTQAGIRNDFGSVLDHGGDRGQMLGDLKSARKAVYEISGVASEPGIEPVHEDEMRAGKWDLILSCHVLEHLAFPAALVADLVTLGGSGTVYFIEVPNESVPTSGFNGTAVQRRWLQWLIEHPRLFKFFDFLSTGIRARLGVVLPFLFFPLREHLTFFTVHGVKSMLNDKGLTVLAANIMSTGHIGVVAVKR
jgi:Methyltransferase domain